LNSYSVASGALLFPVFTAATFTTTCRRRAHSRRSNLPLIAIPYEHAICVFLADEVIQRFAIAAKYCTRGSYIDQRHGLPFADIERFADMVSH
jgi:hypothetical protein